MNTLKSRSELNVCVAGPWKAGCRVCESRSVPHLSQTYMRKRWDVVWMRAFRICQWVFTCTTGLLFRSFPPDYSLSVSTQLHKTIPQGAYRNYRMPIYIVNTRMTFIGVMSSRCLCTYVIFLLVLDEQNTAVASVYYSKCDYDIYLKRGYAYFHATVCRFWSSYVCLPHTICISLSVQTWPSLSFVFLSWER